MLFQNCPDQFGIGNISLDQLMLTFRQVRKIIPVAGIGQLIQIDYFLTEVSCPVQNEIAANKTGTACNQYGQNQPPNFINLIIIIDKDL
jgi:hypothetical protein